MLDVDVRLAEFIKASHHILEYVQVVGFSRFDDAVENSAGVGARGRLAKQPVFSTYDERLYPALSAIIIDTQ
ncbi:hypothetical protein ALT1644_100132 [Alteromonas macleodii]